MGVASFFCIHQSHTDSPLYRSHLLHSISQSLTLLFGFDGHVCYNHILYNRTKWMFECKSDSAGWIYLSNGHHVLPTCFFLCYPSINIIPCSDTGILLDIINLWCSVHFCNFFFWWWTAVIYFQCVILYIFQTFEWPTVNLLLSAVGVVCRWGEWLL